MTSSTPRFRFWRAGALATLALTGLPACHSVKQDAAPQAAQAAPAETPKAATGANGASAEKAGDTSQAGFAAWLEAYVARRAPLETAAGMASWKANISGKPEDYDASGAADLALQQVESDRQAFAYLKAVRAAGQVTDPILARELEVAYLTFLPNQFDPALAEKIIKLSTAIQGTFNTYRADVGGKKLSDNEVEEVLRTSKDSKERQQVWEASKGIGGAVAKDLVELVKLRNQAARELGYENYYVLSLTQGEQDEKELFKLLDDMAGRAEKSYLEVKSTLDQALAKRSGIAVKDLRPWHYEDRFFQEAPSVGSVDLNPYYKGKDVIELTGQFYDSIGLPARKVIANSDLVGKPGKYQHAYCTDMDRKGDVRVMCSVKDDDYWMNTMLHEIGHAVYSLGHDGNPELPWLLRDAAHTLTTEGFAEMTGRLGDNPYWMKRFLGITDAQVRELEPRLRFKGRIGALVFAQWCQVMAHFERDLYRNPDQDLNGLWWQYVAKYQHLTPPDGRNAPDWASKIHLVSSPVYYHNYLLGELYAAQLHAQVAKTFFPGKDPWTVIYADNKEVGKYFDERVFRPGSLWRWDKFVMESTGEPLSARAWEAAYVK